MTEFDRTRDAFVIALMDGVTQSVYDITKHIMTNDDPEIIGELAVAIRQGVADMITVGSIRSPAHRRD